MRNRLGRARVISAHYLKRCLSLVLRKTVGGASRLHRTLEAFQPWGIVLALVSLLGTSIAFMIESEDRQTERTFRAWDVVIASTRDTPSQASQQGLNIHTPSAGLRRGLEYLNRDFQGRWCSDLVRAVSVYVTGNEQRRCVFPRKPREFLVALDLKKESLQGIQLSGAQLAFTDFAGAFLIEANLSGATLLFAKFSNALVVATNFRDADFQNTVLDKTKFGCTGEFGNRECTDLRGAKI